MNVIDIFLEFHQTLSKDRYIERLFDKLGEEQLRTRPYPTVNSIAWLLWHMARVEDAGINRLVVAQPQVLDEGDWNTRMNVPIHHHGTGMTDPEVTELSQRINMAALRAYLDAVRTKTATVVKTLTLEHLDERNNLTYLHQVLFEEGMLNPAKDWGDSPPYQASKGELLIHFGVTHNYGHIYEAFTICSLLGVSPW
ncbi:MAG: DinB family protein [Caldilineaceae bacterium]